MTILETQHLILRTWKDEDLYAMVIIVQEPKVYKFLASIGKRETTEAYVKLIIQHYQDHGFCFYAVELRSTQEFIAWIGLAISTFVAHFSPAVEIGWRLASRHSNKVTRQNIPYDPTCYIV